MALWVRHTGRIVVVAGVATAAMMAVSSTANASDSNVLGDLSGLAGSTNTETAHKHVDDTLNPILGLVDADVLTNSSTTTTRRPTSPIPAEHVGEAPVEEIAPADQRAPTVPANGDSSVTLPPVMSSDTAEDGADAGISSTDCADLKSAAPEPASDRHRCARGHDMGGTVQKGSGSGQSSGYRVPAPRPRPNEPASAPVTAPPATVSSYAQPGTADSSGLGRALLELVSGHLATQSASAASTAPATATPERSGSVPGIGLSEPESGVGDLTRLDSGALEPVTSLRGGFRPLANTVDQVGGGAVEPVVGSVTRPAESATGPGGLSVPVTFSGVGEMVSGLLSSGQSRPSGVDPSAGHDDADHGHTGALAGSEPVPALGSTVVDGGVSCFTPGPDACAHAGASAGNGPATGVSSPDGRAGDRAGERRALDIPVPGSTGDPRDPGSGGLAGGSAQSGGVINPGPADTEALGLPGQPDTGHASAASWRLPGSHSSVPGHSPD